MKLGLEKQVVLPVPHARTFLHRTRACLDQLIFYCDAASVVRSGFDLIARQ
jgi:hypothetical protein